MEPVVWAERAARVTERVPGLRKARRGAISLGLLSAVVWILPVHTVAALILGVAISAAALIGSPQG